MHVFVMDVTYKNIALQDERSEQAGQYTFLNNFLFFPFLIFFSILNISPSRAKYQNLSITLPVSLSVAASFSFCDGEVLT